MKIGDIREIYCQSEREEKEIIAIPVHKEISPK